MSFVIGVGGGSGSGKTTLANRLKEIYKDDLVIIQYDMYCVDQSHLPMSERDLVNYDVPEAYDYELLIKHIDDLKNNKSIMRPTFDFSKHSRTDELKDCTPKETLLIPYFLNKQIFS